jgi:4-hydroxy-tetrahydrodipicolinate reductase
MTTIALTGAAGRMGMRLITLAKADSDLQVVAALDRPDHPLQSQDAGEIAGIGKINVPITFDLQPTPQVLIDFSSPASTRHWLKTCRDRKIAMVIGTTGLQSADHAAIDQAAADIAILQAPNTSLGVNLLFKIAGEVAKILGDDYDIEIVEGHHRFKKDAPSGTALGLADAILKATNKTRDALVYDRHGDDCVRKPGQIGMHALRMGDVVGEHSAFFANQGERIELRHVASTRDTFATGALRCAKWLAKQPPGRYTMNDVLGL